MRGRGNGINFASPQLPTLRLGDGGRTDGPGLRAHCGSMSTDDSNLINEIGLAKFIPTSAPRVHFLSLLVRILNALVCVGKCVRSRPRVSVWGMGTHAKATGADMGQDTCKGNLELRCHVWWHKVRLPGRVTFPTPAHSACDVLVIQKKTHALDGSHMGRYRRGESRGPPWPLQSVTPHTQG